MRKKVLMVMLLFSLTLVSANAQNGGLYVYTGGSFKLIKESTKQASVAQDKSSKSSSRQMQFSADLGLGYLFSPAKDGQGVSWDAYVSLGRILDEYQNIKDKDDSKIAMYGVGTSLGYHTKLLPNIYSVPQISISYIRSTPSVYNASGRTWVEGRSSNSYGITFCPFCVEYRSDIGYALGLSFGGIGYLSMQNGEDAPVHGWTFDFSTFGVSLIYYL